MKKGMKTIHTRWGGYKMSMSEIDNKKRSTQLTVGEKVLERGKIASGGDKSFSPSLTSMTCYMGDFFHPVTLCQCIEKLPRKRRAHIPS